jgi:hypothetical protein
MSKSFKVLARDGSEYRPAKPETLYHWYRDGRIARDSLVCEKGRSNWRRLDAVFDIASWDAVVPNEKPNVLNFTPKPPTEAGWDDDSRTPGMLAAAVLLVIDAFVSVLLAGFLFATPTPGLQGKEMVSPTFMLMSVPIMDLIMGVGLVRGKWQFRRFVMIRASLGVILVLTRAIFFKSPGGWVELVFQIVFAVGMFALLYGGLPSRERVFVGVVAVVLGWFGPLGGVFVDDYLGYTIAEPPLREEAEPWAAERVRYTSGMLIEDFEAGFRMEVPSAWSLKTQLDGESSAPGTKLIANNSTAGCSAMLQVDVDSSEVATLDEYLTRLVKTREKSVPSLTVGTRSDVMIGGRRGRSLQTSWNEGITPFIGFTTVCRDGSRHFVLTGWCERSVYEFAFPAFQVLESRIEFTARRE